MLRAREEISRYYLCYVLNSMDLTSYVTGTTVPKLNQENMSSIKVPLPPISEQKRIVSKIEELFEALDQIQNNLV